MIRSGSFVIALLIVSLFTTVSMGNDKMKNASENHQFRSIEQIPPQKWKELKQKRIFFAHQSIGNNILEGIREIESKNDNIQLQITETKDIIGSDNGVFFHFPDIGRNDYPLSKIQEFSTILKKNDSKNLDIAFLKFCFLDFKSGTDLESIFKDYIEMVREIKTAYPDLKVVHFTVPLLKREKLNFLSKAKKAVKRLVGKEIDGFFADKHNIVRNEYNTLLLNYYRGKEPIFDIARLESTFSDGSRERFFHDGKEYYALIPDYTDDGGHLNQTGRHYIAEQLLIFLADL